MSSSGREMPTQMLAVQLVNHKSAPVVQKTQAPNPAQLGPYELIVKTGVASLCHTDLMVQAGFVPTLTGLPMTMSHEGTGTVVALGSKVETLRLGDRVMSGIKLDTCGTCENCNAPPGKDWNQYCFSGGGASGITTHGSFADYHVADSRFSSKLPDEVSFLTGAPMACAGITVYRAVKVAGESIPEGGWLAIVGAGGGLGHLGVQFAKAAGIKVIGIDARDEGLEIARKFGADHVLDARESKEEVVKKVQALTGGKGVDTTVNVSDHPSTAALSAAITRMHGVVVQAAQPLEVSVPFQEIVLRDITIKGTMHGGKDLSDDMLQVVAKHGIKAETQIFEGLERVPEMFELLEAGKIKGKAVCVVDKTSV